MDAALHILIIDHDPLERSQLAFQIGHFDHTCFCYQASNEVEAHQILNNAPINLVFLDAQLPGDGYIQLASTIKDSKCKPLMIFSTEPDQHILAILKHSDMPFLLKPYDEERTIATISLALYMLRYPQIKQKSDESLAALCAGGFEFVVDTLIGVLPSREQVVMNFDEVQWLEAKTNGSNAYSKKYPAPIHVSTDLKTLEGMLIAHDFFRISERNVVNLSWVHQIGHGDDEDNYLISMVGFEDTQLTLLAEYADLLDARFDF
jgi:DNA-binding LytR/AlgR family response regulator